MFALSNFIIMQKIKCISMLILLLCGTALFSVAQYDSIVNVHRVKYQKIHNKLDDYETVKSTFTVESGENVQATAYYEGYDLKFIEVIFLSESGHRQIEYYFENGNLYFVLERDQSSGETITLNSKGTKNNKAGTTASGSSGVTENHYYFYEDKLIRWYDNEKKVVDLNAGSNSITGYGLLENAYKMKEKLKK
jgi:hypothetical protein